MRLDPASAEEEGLASPIPEREDPAYAGSSLSACFIYFTNSFERAHEFVPKKKPHYVRLDHALRRKRDSNPR